MSNQDLEREASMLIMMRKTLSAIIRDVTPLPGMQSPLKEETVQSIRHCLGRIAAREQEIAQALGKIVRERPRYGDDPATSQVLKFKPGSSKDGDRSGR